MHVPILYTEISLPGHHCEHQYSEFLAFYKLQLLLPPQAAALHTSDEELAENQISTCSYCPASSSYEAPVFITIAYLLGR